MTSQQHQELVIASHSRELIVRLCNRVIWLKHGRIVADGEPRTVVPQYFVDNPVAT